MVQVPLQRHLTTRAYHVPGSLKSKMSRYAIYRHAIPFNFHHISWWDLIVITFTKFSYGASSMLPSMMRCSLSAVLRSKGSGICDCLFTIDLSCFVLVPDANPSWWFVQFCSSVCKYSIYRPCWSSVCMYSKMPLVKQVHQRSYGA